jgi:hypothetical protein
MASVYDVCHRTTLTSGQRSLLLSISTAIDHLMAPMKDKARKRGLGTTKISKTVSQQNP